MNNIHTADFPTPKGVNAFYTTRHSGVSKAPFDSYNIALHVGDQQQDVLVNRSMLPKAESIAWLQQIHSARCIEVKDDYFLPLETSKADASFTTLSNTVCAVMTADCLPILIFDQYATCVAAVHAGWKGLASGVIQNTVGKMPVSPERLLMWVGPHISAQHFEVGEDVREQFAKFPSAFKAITNTNKYRCNLLTITKQIANSMGITQIFGGNLCTYANATDFFSYRRSVHEGESQTGRLLCGIYLD